MKFEWDKNKEKINIQKHGVTFEQASYVFADQFAFLVPTLLSGDGYSHIFILTTNKNHSKIKPKEIYKKDRV